MVRSYLLAGDPFVFAADVYLALGGPPDVDRDVIDEQRDLRRLASEALRYVQMYEALGRPPTPEEFGADRLQWDLVGGIDVGWPRFEQIIEAKRMVPSSIETPPPPPPSAQPLPPSSQPPPVGGPIYRARSVQAESSPTVGELALATLDAFVAGPR